MAWHGSINSHELLSTTCCSSHLSLPAPIRSKYFVVLLAGSNETCVCGGGSHTVYMRAAGVLVGGSSLLPRSKDSTLPFLLPCLGKLPTKYYSGKPRLFPPSCPLLLHKKPASLRHTFFQSFLFSSLITANSELPSIKQIRIQIMNCSPSLAKWCCVMLLLIRKILITQECKAGYSRGQSSTKQLLTVSSLSS